MLGPDQAWGLEVWKAPLDPEAIEISLDIYDWFYQEIGQRLDALAALTPFVVLDIHSYNHRRDGADQPPADPAANPDVNIGTGSLDRRRGLRSIDRFTEDLTNGFACDSDRRRERAFQRWTLFAMDRRALRRPWVRTCSGVQEDLHGRMERRGQPRSRRPAARGACRPRCPGLLSELQAKAMTSPVATDLAIDRELASISESFRFLVDVTPINVEEARKRVSGLTRQGATLPVPRHRGLSGGDRRQIGCSRYRLGRRSSTRPNLSKPSDANLSLQLEMLSARGPPGSSN